MDSKNGGAIFSAEPRVEGRGKRLLCVMGKMIIGGGGGGGGGSGKAGGWR